MALKTKQYNNFNRVFMNLFKICSELKLNNNYT